MSDCNCGTEQADELERKTLISLLAINLTMFFVEFGFGWLGESTGLIADSLDMLADASVYAISLYAVGKALSIKSQAARSSGILQIALGFLVLLDVIRRYLFGSEPVGFLMMAVGLLALASNLLCLALIAKHRNAGIHMRASWIFSTNDAIANTGIIISGALVFLLDSRYPDLLIGLVISFVVIRGGFKILGEVKEVRENGN